MKRYVYYAYNKPAGVVTHSPENGQRSIVQMLSLPNDVVPVGRLDKESRGLILLSNDGRITQRILHPDYDHEKEYIVKVDKPIENILIKVMQQGVALEDCTTKPSTVTKIDEITFRIILTEGKKHQIRRMTAALGWQVTDLKRVRILNITLSNIYPGQARKVTGEELKKFLVLLGLN